MFKTWSVAFCESVLLNIINLRNEEMTLKAKLSALCIHYSYRCFEMVLLLEIKRCRRLQLSLEFLHAD